MKALAITIVLIGFVGFWSVLVFRANRTVREETRAETVALNYAQFRNAVLDYALGVKSAGVGPLLPDNPNLRLPQGWASLRDWRGLIQMEAADGRLYCYVYGPATPEEVAAVQVLFYQNMTIGWNNGGMLTRNGHLLPAAIPNRNIVSAIRLD